MSLTAQIEQKLSTESLVYLYSDHLYTARLATDQNQNVVWRWEGEAFGNTAAQDVGGVRVNIRFPGQYFDQETGLHYNWNRYYDPELGRYITSDPIGLYGGLNTYSYALQNPLKYSDPKGLNVATGIGVTVGICARYPQACGAAAGVATCAITGMCSKPSWWPDDIPHPSDPPKETQCSTSQPTDAPPPIPDPGGGCKALFDNLLKQCESKSGKSRQFCVAKATAAFLICQIFKGD